MDQKLSTKAFIVRNKQVFLVERSQKENEKPGEWDLPGGQLEHGEDPAIGLRREVREETGMQVEIVLPIGVQRYAAENAMVTLIIYLCTPVLEDTEIKLSEEHSNYKWVDIDSDEFPSWITHIVGQIQKFDLLSKI